jgi:hypothetical protein
MTTLKGQASKNTRNLLYLGVSVYNLDAPSRWLMPSNSVLKLTSINSNRSNWCPHLTLDIRIISATQNPNGHSGNYVTNKEGK